jgi:hypothetical protein
MGTPASIIRLVAHGLDRRGGRADEDEARLLYGPREWSSFGEEAIAGMNGLDAGAAGDLQDPVYAEIALRRGRRAHAVRLIGEEHVRSPPVGLGEYGHRPNPRLAAGTDDPHRDLAAVGDQQALEHAGVPPTRFRSRASTQGNGR